MTNATTNFHLGDSEVLGTCEVLVAGVTVQEYYINGAEYLIMENSTLTKGLI